jgi:hypothetical protein
VGSHISHIEAERARVFGQHDRGSLTGAVSSVSMVPLRFSSASRRMVSTGITTSMVIQKKGNRRAGS